MNLKDKIQEIVEKHLSASLFLVKLTVFDDPNVGKVAVFIDSEEGLQLDQCVDLTRKLNEELDALEIMSGKYTLEVSSPGLEEPLQALRQYKKNIGREVQITLSAEKTIKARLDAVTEEGITVSPIQMRGKIKGYKKVTEFVPFADIVKTKVLITFS